MKIHEYQAKEILRQYKISVPEGVAALSKKEALDALSQVPAPWVVKAQIHAGGRGKGGGVRLAKTRQEAEAAIEAMWGMQLVTHQTGPEGKRVQRLYVEHASSIAKEFYFAMTLDRQRSQVVVMVSPQGGMDIEEVAQKSPERIFKVWVDPCLGVRGYQSRWLGKSGLGLDDKALKSFQSTVARCMTAYVECDASLLEINPLILTADHSLVALDAKVNFDDNALFRHPDLAGLRDPSEEDPKELAAKKFELNYISLDGTIGCMVNGAGLAMATMDIIQQAGGHPANFLDVGGGASADQVKEAFQILVSDEKVNAILVNIFGGIMRCDVIAEGIIAAARALRLQVPVVVRLEGTNVEQGKALLEKSGLAIVPASDLADAARKVVASSKRH